MKLEEILNKFPYGTVKIKMHGKTAAIIPPQEIEWRDEDFKQIRFKVTIEEPIKIDQ